MKPVHRTYWECGQCGKAHEEKSEAKLCCDKGAIDFLELGSRVASRQYPDERGTVVYVSTFKGKPLFVLKPDNECSETDWWNLQPFNLEQIQMDWRKA